MKKPTCTLYIKMCTCTFFSFYSYVNETQKKKKKTTGNSYNLIANHFHVKTASKFKFVRKRKKRFFFCFFFKRGSFRSAQVGKQNEELFIFERGVFWSCPGRNSRVVKAEILGAFARHIPVLSLYGSTLTPPPRVPSHLPGLEFCNFRLENEFRTNFNPILTKC